MKTIAIRLESHYGTLPELKLRMGEEKYGKLCNFIKKEPFPNEAETRTVANAIAFDLDRLAYNEKPVFFTVSQLGKITDMYAGGNTDFYESIAK